MAVLGDFAWSDLSTSDPGAAERFYTAVFGWEVQAWEKEPSYRMWFFGGKALGGVSQLNESAVPGWLAYVSVADSHAAARQVEERGGRVVTPPTEIANGGRFLVFADPQGAVLAAYQRGAADILPKGVPGVGEFSWHELATTDSAAALSFYTDLFGWVRTAEVDMGEFGMYRMFGSDGASFGGAYSVQGQLPAWLHYVRVDDLEATVAKVAQHGGKIVAEPMDVPGGDRVATALDPQGIMFALHEKGPA